MSTSELVSILMASLILGLIVSHKVLLSLLPILKLISFGGDPNRDIISGKSASFETIIILPESLAFF